jgi:hypothetical protein
MTPDASVVHVALPDAARVAACGAPGNEVVSWEDACRPAGRHFTCVECHKVISGGDRHVSAR